MPKTSSWSCPALKRNVWDLAAYELSDIPFQEGNLSTERRSTLEKPRLEFPNHINVVVSVDLLPLPVIR
jgi:hypothetical protein